MTPVENRFFEAARQIALSFPGMEEGTAYGTPAFRVRGRFLARLQEDGESLSIRIDELERDLLLQAEPEVYYLTPHYEKWGGILVRLSKVSPEALHHLFEQGWRSLATKKLLAEYQR